jgi:hypothetical protein
MHLQGSNCLLLTSAALRMLVPRAVVAEVLGPSFLEFARDEATGLEFFGWRGRRVPLLDGPALGATRAAEFTDESKVAIFHGLKHQRLLPYYGCVITRTPRLLRVAEGDLEEVTGVQLHPAELMRIRVDGDEACIPKVDHFESTLIDLMKAQSTK